MAKKEEGYNVSESGNWNAAAEYSKLKIVKPLASCDHYENIAQFGYDSILDQIENYGVPTDALKLLGFERLVNELLRLVSNSKFALKDQDSINKMDNFKTRLEKIKSITPHLSKIRRQRNKTQYIQIIPGDYNKALKIVLEIKADINTPLNKNSLIFVDKEAFDPKKYKKEIFENATTRG